MMEKKFKRISVSGDGFDAEVTIKDPVVVDNMSVATEDELKWMLSTFIKSYAIILDKVKQARAAGKTRLPIAYLCGSMEFATDFGVNWRVKLTNELKHYIDMRDPCKIESEDIGLGETKAILTEAKHTKDWNALNKIMGPIKERDYEAIDESDFTIVLLDHTSGPGGTYCELEYTLTSGKLIYAICPGDIEKENSWILNTVIESGGEIFTSFDKLILFLKTLKWSI